ncbi:MAG: M1 family aminopeptidase [Candidatus Zixiibacteriota bacterium]
MRRRYAVIAAFIVAVISASLFAADDDSLDYEQVMKSHMARLSRYAQSLASLGATANQNDFDINYYDISIRIHAETNTIAGEVGFSATTLQPLDFVELNLDQTMIVDSVTTSGAATTFQHQGNILTIVVPQHGTGEFIGATVFYHGRPIFDGFGSFSFNKHNDLPLVSSLSEPFYARTWWPCKDHPSDKADSVDMRATIDSRVTVVSNGTLAGITANGDGTNTTHWHESYPIATYLVSLAIADYEHYADTFHYEGESMPVDFYMLSGLVEQHFAVNAKVVGMLEYFSSIYGTYPFIREKYGHAQFAWGGGMEHQTCSSIGAFPESLLAHELAHQWWGDMITCGTWHDIWLNEGFARYSEALWLEHVNGPQALQQYMNSLTRLDQQVYVADTTNVNTMFDRVVYDKGAMALHMLRFNLGDEMFFRVIRAYGESRHKYNSATTSDFQALCEDISGRDLQYFFDQWVYQPSMPDYRFGFFSYETDSGWVTDLQMQQVQTAYELFKTDMDVRFWFASDSLTLRVSNDRRKQNFRYLLPDEPIKCRIDPDNWIINKYTEVALLPQATVDTLPTAAVGAPYSLRLSAIGGEPPFTWSEFAASMPEGFAIDDDGLLHGVAADTGSFEISVQIADSRIPANRATSNLKLQIHRARGNVDANPGMALGDILYFIRYLYRDGPPPADLTAADANCDGDVDILDVMTILNFLYQQGPLPCFES